MKFSSIVESLRTEVATILGTDWNRLAYVYDVNKNDTKTIQKGYGVRSLAAIEIDDLIGKNVSVEHSIEIILTNDYVSSGANDDNVEDEIVTLQDSAQLIYESIVYKKWNSNIILVSDLSIEEPELLEDNGLALRFSVTIRYRVQLT